jgi:ABC-type Mn2+/Zn2+ transport system permease subunit
MDWLLEPFESALMQRALAEAAVAGILCGPLGVWVLLYRQVYAAESLAHGMLPGLVVAALVGAPLLLGAAVGVVLAAGAIALAGHDERLGSDVAVGVAVSALLGAGALLAALPATPPRLGELLFGDLLGVLPRDLLVSAAMAALLLGALAAGHRRLALASFDPAASASLGAAPARWGALLLIALGLGTVAVVQGLGNLLLVALLVAPAATALRLVHRLVVAMALAAGIGVLSGAAGLLVSFHFDVAAGAAVALCALAAWLLSLPFPHGHLSRPARVGGSGT